MESMDISVTVNRATSAVTVELILTSVPAVLVKMVQPAMTKSMVTTVHVLQDMPVRPATIIFFLKYLSHMKFRGMIFTVNSYM